MPFPILPATPLLLRLAARRICIMRNVNVTEAVCEMSRSLSNHPSPDVSPSFASRFLFRHTFFHCDEYTYAKRELQPHPARKDTEQTRKARRDNDSHRPCRR